MKSFLVIPFASFLAVFVSCAAETGPLIEALEPFRPYLGKTWRGQFKSSKPDKPTIDVARWERALNGKALSGGTANRSRSRITTTPPPGS